MKKNLRNILLIILAAAYFLPVAATFLKSFQYGNRLFSLKQYTELFVNNYLYFHFFWNSVFYAVAGAALCIVLSLPLGLLFAKIRFKFREAIFFFYVVVMMMPFQATMLPGYIFLRDMKCLNTPAALILPFLFSPVAVFLFRQFMKAIPDELMDYTRLETSSALVLLRSVVIPQIKPAIVTLFIILFCEIWNMVEQAQTFAPQNMDIMPLSVMLDKLPEEVMFSGSTVYMFPIIMLFLFAEEFLYKGMERYKW